MHSSRMRTARSLTVSHRICQGGHVWHARPLPCTPPTITTHVPLPCMPHLPHMPPTAIHAYCHARTPAMHTPLPCKPPCHAHPPLPCKFPAMHTHAMYAPPAMHAPRHTCPPAMHAPSPPHMPPCHARPPPPVDRQTPVKTKPSQNSFARGNKMWHCQF